jgi:hypothetical protein
LNTVVEQSLPADTVINGLKDQVTLYVCSEVVSQSKYKTLIYVTSTPTVTGTIPPTSTPKATLVERPQTDVEQFLAMLRFENRSKAEELISV